MFPAARVINKLSCADLNTCYVSETNRHRATRVRGHLATNKNSDGFQYLKACLYWFIFVMYNLLQELEIDKYIPNFYRDKCLDSPVISYNPGKENQTFADFIAVNPWHRLHAFSTLKSRRPCLLRRKNQATWPSFDVTLLLSFWFFIVSFSFFSLLFVFSVILLNARTHLQ